MTANSKPYGLYSRYPDAVIIADPDTKEIVETNQAATELFGYSRETLRSKDVLDLHPSDERHQYKTLFERHFETEPAAISRFKDGSPVYVVTAGGEHIPVEIHAWTLKDEEHDRDSPLFQGVFQDISTRLDYERQLREQRDSLEILNQTLTHDIRNDLHVVSAYADVLDDYVDEDGAEYLRKIQTSASNVVELTQTARDMADAMLVTRENHHPMSLRGTLRGEIDEIRSEYSNAVITVEKSIPATKVVANELLSSVFRNLLTNAVQHNDKEVAEVRVSVSEGSESVTVRIADNGPGIPDERKETIFGKGEMGIESAGTGIGLYLVETLVERYGGDAWVEDGELGGATFVVELARADR
jgi:PAS domain S-box-containing protein